MMPTSLLWLPISRALNSRCSDGGKKQSRLTRRCYERAKQQASIGKGGQAGCRQDQHPILLYDCSKEYNCLILFMFTAKTPLARAQKWVAAGSIYWENGCRNVGTTSLEPESRRRFESGLRHRIKEARRASLQSPRQKEWPLPCCSSHIAADLDTLSITCSTEGHPALFASTA